MRALAILIVLVPALAWAEDPQVSPVLVINRCVGGCVIHGGTDDAKAMSSSIPCPSGPICSGGGCTCNGSPAGDYTVEEFKSGDQTIGSNGKCRGGTAAGTLCTDANEATVCTGGGICYSANDEWADIMLCVREVYSPFNVTIRDTVPTDGSSYNMGILAGKPQNIASSGGGIAPPTGCGPRDNVISFSFANSYPVTGRSRVLGLCGIVAQETAHAYGLDHAYQMSDGSSACVDPMTYRPDCGQKFFRNDNATCGEQGPRPCSCGGFQNSHLKILAIFGAGTPITSPPAIMLTGPAANTTLPSTFNVTAKASAQRGIARIEMWINNYLWATAKGVAFASGGATGGQPEANYSLTVPTMVPDSILDIQLKAFDDIDVETDAPLLTVTKGAPCADASTCAKGQQCTDGRCFWAAPVGEIGDTCDYAQFCVSGSCVDTTDGAICSKECVVDVMDSCPMGFICDGAEGGKGFCVEDSPSSGCCSVGGDRRAAAMLSLIVLGLVVRRRRPR